MGSPPLLAREAELPRRRFPASLKENGGEGAVLGISVHAMPFFSPGRKSLPVPSVLGSRDDQRRTYLPSSLR
jgi:hypothetical protein